MSLKGKFTLYLLVVHLIFATVVVYLLRDNRIWLIGVEIFFIVSFLYARRLFRGLFRPLELLSTGAEIMKEKDFTVKFHEIGQPEMDQLIDIYNRMIDHLREERIRLQEQHFFLEKILTASPAAIITCDYDERITFTNPAAEQLLQIRFSEMKGKKFRDLPIPFAETLDSLTMGDSCVAPLWGIRRVKCYKSHFLDQGFRRTFILIEELTEELRQSEKAAYEKLIRMMSHEVNNSIGAANSLLHSSLHYKNQLREEDRKDFETALTVAISRTDHLNSFMKSFADIVRLPLPRLQPTDLRQLLEHIEHLMMNECRERNILWAWDIRENIEPAPMDKAQMEQVYLNICKNAMEAIGRDGTITVRMGKHGRKNFVTIEDTGSGIHPDVRPHLFTPFFSTKENGQGIGLTLVQEILTQHHFEFTLDSEPGKTTRFTVYFP